MTSKRVLLIDGDIIAYRAAASVERPVNWGDGLWTLHSHEDEAIAIVENYHEKLMDELKADHAVYALTDSERNWRYDILPTYKHNRKETRKPLLLQFLREYLVNNHEAYLRPRLEGDDVLGILATHPYLLKADEKIIVSLDKDLKTVPGLVYNEQKDEEPREITESEADYWHMLQTLMGDTTDGYSGCPGVGEKAATEALAAGRVYEPYTHVMKSGPRKGVEEVRWQLGEEGTPWEVVRSVFARAGLTEEDAIRQARVARICRSEDYNYQAKEVIHWTPK